MMNKWKVPLNKPFFSDETKELVMNVLNCGMVSQGEMVEQFEEEVRKYVGAKYALAVSNCTAGMWMVLRRMIVGKNKINSINIPAFTFPAINECARELVRRITLTDVDLITYNTIPSQIFHERVITPIHQFGMPCNMDAIRKTAKETESFVLEDAACALGSKYKGKMIGSEGTAVFSFHGRKILTTGEGGMILTDDEELYERCLLMRQFGRSKTGQFEGDGLNFKMSDVAAAMGLGQMKEIETAVDMRRWWADEYRDRLMEQAIRPPYKGIWPDHRGVGPEYETNYQSYVVDLGDVDTGKTRDAVLHKMRANGIEAQVGSYDQSNGTCKNSARLAATTLALPIWPEMTLEDIDMVINALEEALA
jgi:dTDP-4-amino-4,6-dideoxygalactose transaminase